MKIDFLEQAFIYCGMGFKVIPLKPMSKEAFTPHGVYDATDDENTIGEWASATPTANIGFACGPEANATVVDVDRHHGGVETMAALVKRHGELPKCPMSQTPRGGYHLIFAHDKRVGCSTNVLGKGLDVKSKGGYIVLPPSEWDGFTKGKKVCDGGVYKWIRAPRGTSFPAMPDWMIKKLMPKPVARFNPKSWDKTDASLVDAAKALKYISNHDYGVWIDLGMAMKSGFGDAGFDLWDNWSCSGYTDHNSKECRAKWRSFKRNDGIQIGTLFYHARLAGADLTQIFKKERRAA